MSTGLVDHFFRHEYGRLVAVLSRRMGVNNLEAVEDGVQSALMTALESWKVNGPPDNPSGWLFRVAHNNVLDELRRRSGRRKILKAQPPVERSPGDDEPTAFLAGEVRDDLLRMLFLCCDEAIPPESQLVLALKTLCGFSVGEIAHRLFTTEANVYKRLGRARAKLRERPALFEELSVADMTTRLPAVHKILYVLFTEGHLSSHAEMSLRRELCDEAIRLALILAEHPIGDTPVTAALLALMHLHVARMSSRQDEAGGLLLLDEQDRSRWDQTAIEAGLGWLSASAKGDVFSRYHAEAAIAAEHCLAASVAETRWDKVADNYSLLEQVSPSPLHRLNRAVAVAEAAGPEAGLAVLEGFEPPSWLAGSYMWSAVLADLHRRCGHQPEAARHRDAALRTAPHDAVRALLMRRLGP